MLLLSCRLVFCGNREDTVGIDIEGDFDLRYSTGSRSDTVEVEDTDLFVVLSHRALTLEDSDLN